MEFYRKRLVEAIANRNEWDKKYYKQQYLSALRVLIKLKDVSWAK